MSTGNPAAPATRSSREVRVYSHSTLFYWWPVWVTGFLMALLTMVDGHYMAIVPDGTKAEIGRDIYKDGKVYEALVLPENAKLPRDDAGKVVEPFLHMAKSKNYGVVFVVVLLIVTMIVSVPMRGLWSLVLILFVFLVSVILALAKWWDMILEKFGHIQIHVNAGGYLFLSVPLFILWLITVFVFDRRHYLVVTPGQVRVCLAVGAGETAYDTVGMTFQKRRDDLFRHLVVGMGSGDLIVTTGKGVEIDLPNVLFVGSKVREIEDLIKEKEVV